MQPKYRVSASQIELFQRCPRSWYFRYIDGHVTPSKPAQRRGTRIHWVQEYTLTNKRLPPADVWPIDPDEDPDEAREHYTLGCRLVEEALRKNDIPSLDTEVACETEIALQVTPEASLIGYVDLIWQTSDVLHVDDTKTTSSFDNNKTPQQLLENIQLGVYAKWAASLTPEAPIVVGHVYYFTGNKIKVKTCRVETPITQKDIDTTWARVVNVTEQIVTLRKTKEAQGDKHTADAVTPSGVMTGECSAYGGCPHRARCGLETGVILSGGAQTMEIKEPNNTPTLLDKLRASLVKPAEVTPAAPVVTAPETPVSVPVTEGIIPPDAPPRESPYATADLDVPNPVVKRRGRPPKVKAEAPAVYCPACNNRIALDTEGAILDHWGVDVHMQRDSMAPCVATGDTPDDVIKWIIGVPRGQAASSDEITLTYDPGQEPTSASEVVADLTAALAKKNAEIKELLEIAKMGVKSEAAAMALTIYVDCYPAKGAPPVLFEDWIAPTIEAFTKATGVPAPELIKYKEGTGALVGLLRQRVAAGGLPEAIYVTTRSRGWDAAQEILIPLAARVIRAMH